MWKVFRSRLSGDSKNHCKSNSDNNWLDDVSGLNKTIKDKQGNIIGGLKCYLYGWKCLYIELFWVKEEYRKKGCGSQLLREVERAAKEQGCYLAHVDTFDFQGKGFYEKHGYEVFGVLEVVSRKKVTNESIWEAGL